MNERLKSELTDTLSMARDQIKWLDKMVVKYALIRPRSTITALNRINEAIKKVGEA